MGASSTGDLITVLSVEQFVPEEGMGLAMKTGTHSYHSHITFESFSKLDR